MAGKQLVKSGIIPKSNVNNLSSVMYCFLSIVLFFCATKIQLHDILNKCITQASCSRGWLRIVVQYIFGAITVASFVLIVLMSMQNPTREDNTRPSTCFEQNCMIVCNDTSASFNEDVYVVIAESMLCPRLSLVFISPIFVNRTLPAQWLSGIRSIYELIIRGGNLRFIAPQAFMSLFAGNIEIFSIEDITIENWAADTLVGLSSLRQLYIKNSNLIDIQRNALQAVDDTLEVLTITRNGNWDPRNISGSTEMLTLGTVDFSFNTFDKILSNESFLGIKHCRILYLNSCKITALGTGTFDHLHIIEVIYLNNNMLVTLPTGLFDGMINQINPKPRINLQDNPWYCDCESHDLRYLHYYGLLYVDPTCDTPKELYGEPFSAISTFCANDTYADVIVVDLVELQKDTGNNVVTSYTSGCQPSSNDSFRLITPNEINSCEKNFTLLSIKALQARSNVIYEDITKSDWITPTYLMRTEDYSMVQISSLTSDEYGIVWFKTSCLNEIYCISTLPKFLRVYDLNLSAHYTFCPIDLENGYVRVDKCVDYSAVANETKPLVQVFGSIVLYICTSLVCLAFGAAFVYGIIRYNPVLLKGSKRLLFVKHKNVDALVLPPKVPLRSTWSNPDPDPIFNITEICVLPDNKNNLSPRSFVRMKSTRSDKSTVSYISALQPTEDQLAEWRIKKLFDNNITVTSDSEMSIISWINDDSSTPEYINSFTYGSLK